MKTNTDTRRAALKKLGITSGAAWVAPTVATLVVPKHATATSTSSSSGSSAGGLIVSVWRDSASHGTFEITSTTDYSGATFVLSIDGAAILTHGNPLFTGTTTMFGFTTAADFTSGTSTFSGSVDGTAVSGTVV